MSWRRQNTAEWLPALTTNDRMSQLSSNKPLQYFKIYSESFIMIVYSALKKYNMKNLKIVTYRCYFIFFIRVPMQDPLVWVSACDVWYLVTNNGAISRPPPPCTLVPVNTHDWSPPFGDFISSLPLPPSPRRKHTPAPPAVTNPAVTPTDSPSLDNF